jgi:heme a synthase
VQTANHPSRLGGFQRLAVVSLFFTLALIALGGAVRATGSGLACPDWPFCYGKVIPRQVDIPPETGYTLWNVWLEHTHRLTASLVGFMVLGLAIWALARYRHRATVLWPSLGAVVLVTVQAGLGAAVVLNLLRADLVTAHLGMAMVVLACLLWITVAAATPEPVTSRSRDRRYAHTVTAVAALSYVQILVGGHMTGIRGGLAYTDFPLMGGAIIPEITSERQAFHVAHRFLAYALAFAVVYLCWRALAHRRELQAAGTWQPRYRWLVKLPMWGATLVIVQIGIGVANLMTRTHPAVVTAHLTVASWIWAVLALATILAYRYAPVRETLADSSQADDAGRVSA